MSEDKTKVKYPFQFHDYGEFYYKKQPENSKDSENANDIYDPRFMVLKKIKSALSKYGYKGLHTIDGESTKLLDDDEKGTFPFGINSINSTVKTGRYVGVIRYNTDEIDATVQIGSRFDKKNSSQLFLSYLLSKAFDGMTLPEHPPNSSNENMWDLLLVFVFVSQLKEAYRQGLFKTYKKFEYNDPKVKGKIDVNRHIRDNTPFVGNIAYSVREHAYDNPMLHLIRHTFERLEKKYPSLMESINKNDKSGTTLTNIKKVINEATSTFSSNNVQSVLLKTNARIDHPYFNKYEPLRKTCRLILRDMGINLFDSNQNQEVYGILIDIAWLWENFAGKEIMEKCGFKHIVGVKTPLLVYGENKVVKRREYDYIKDKVMVLDAKYKPKWANLEWDKLSNDVYQVLSYMFIANVKQCGVIFPFSQGASDNLGIGKYKIWTDHVANAQYSQDYFFLTIPLHIPQTSSSAEDFKEKIEKSIKAIKESI